MTSSASKKSKTKELNTKEIVTELKSINSSLKLKNYIRSQFQTFKILGLLCLLILTFISGIGNYVLFKNIQEMDKKLKSVEIKLSSIQNDVDVVEHKMTHLERMLKSIDRRLKD